MCVCGCVLVVLIHTNLVLRFIVECNKITLGILNILSMTSL